MQVCPRDRSRVAPGVAGCWDGHCGSLQKREAGGMLSISAAPARASPCPTEGWGRARTHTAAPGPDCPCAELHPALLRDPSPVIRLREKAPTSPTGKAGPGDRPSEGASPPARRRRRGARLHQGNGSAGRGGAGGRGVLRGWAAAHPQTHPSWGSPLPCCREGRGSPPALGLVGSPQRWAI